MQNRKKIKIKADEIFWFVSKAKQFKFNNMKKIFTLAIASLLTVALFATDRKPSVTIFSTKKYEIVVDGKSYFSSNASSMSIANLRNGNHTVTVYTTNQGFGFRKIKRVVSSTNFMLRNNDVQIVVDQAGRIKVSESRFGKDRDDRGWDKNDKGFDKGYGNDDKGYGKDDKGFGKDNKKNDNRRF